MGRTPVEVACGILGADEDAVQDQMRAFEAAGYVECSGLARAEGDDWWVTTVKGNALANASFGKPISRATATRLLPQVIDGLAATTLTHRGFSRSPRSWSSAAT